MTRVVRARRRWQPRSQPAAAITRSPAFNRGMADAEAGTGFPREYESMALSQQLDYELGRQRAALDGMTVAHTTRDGTSHQ